MFVYGDAMTDCRVSVWIAQKEMDEKRASERAQRLRDEDASLKAEAEKRRAEIRSSV